MSESRTVPPTHAGQALDFLVRQLFQASWGKARSWIESGKVSVDGATVRELRVPVRADATIVLNMNAPKPKTATAGGAKALAGASAPKLGRDRIAYVDPQLVVFDKPPGISAVPYDSSETGTLLEAAQILLGRGRLEIVHRLDKETSGLMLFARTGEAARALANQFRFHTVHRRYLALAHGSVRGATHRSVLVEDRGDGLRGTAPAGWKVAPGQGKEAVTHIAALEALAGATLVECRLETGRTHQIRIHLSEAGHPLLGERLYVREFRGEKLPAPRVMLHAAELGVRHPVSGEELRWRSELPADPQKARLEKFPQGRLRHQAQGYAPARDRQRSLGVFPEVGRLDVRSLPPLALAPVLPGRGSAGPLA